jgi:hypothetical protein
MPSNAEDLYQYVERTFPDHCRFIMKRVVADSPRHDILNLGWNVLVVNPSDVKRGDKERYQKTDALDSKNLSNQLKSGVLRCFYSHRRA